MLSFFTDLPLWLPIIPLVIAAIALVMTVLNLRFFRRSPVHAPPSSAPVAVCIPARNEEANIEACVRSVLAGDHTNIQVLVYDDQSSDATPEILARLQQEDHRVRSVPTRPLPPGWVGKQWACFQLGSAASSDFLLFIDADVRLAPDCLRRTLRAAEDLKADLLSTFPRQITGSFGEALLVPLIHFILLSYLPFPRMRNTQDPNASAACGQFMFFSRAAYAAIGGHGACRDSMHDGVKLPRIVRRAGLRSDLFDGTDVATCRMYTGLVATWQGFAKNAFEGLGSVVLLTVITVLHLVGHVFPWILALLLALSGNLWSPAGILTLACIGVTLTQRAILARRFSQSWLGAVMHPLGVLMMTLVQWHSYFIVRFGARSWKGRTSSIGANPTLAPSVNSANTKSMPTG